MTEPNYAAHPEHFDVLKRVINAIYVHYQTSQKPFQSSTLMKVVGFGTPTLKAHLEFLGNCGVIEPKSLSKKVKSYWVKEWERLEEMYSLVFCEDLAANAMTNLMLKI